MFCLVVDCYSNRKGKYMSMGDVVMTEKKHFMKSFSKATREGFRIAREEFSPKEQILFTDANLEQLFKVIEDMDISGYWLQIVGMFDDRMDIYTKTSTDETSLLIKDISDRLYNSLGVDSNLDVRMMTFSAMTALNLMRIFLDQMFTSTLIVLVMLGALLIYTLMLSDVEEKTYEYGMLRALGMSQKSFVSLLITTTNFFSIPGTIIGMGLSALALWIAVLIVSKVIYYDIPMYYQPLAIILCIVLGLLLPRAANFFPIFRAVNSTLRDSLDLYHQLNNDTRVTFQSLRTMGISLTQTVMAIIVIVFGFMLFYGAPTAFFSGDISSFLFILIWMLVAMLVGLVFISVFFQPIFERWCIHLVVCCGDIRFKG
jgi:hypothetical protein